MCLSNLMIFDIKFSSTNRNMSSVCEYEQLQLEVVSSAENKTIDMHGQAWYQSLLRLFNSKMPYSQQELCAQLIDNPKPSS